MIATWVWLRPTTAHFLYRYRRSIYQLHALIIFRNNRAISEINILRMEQDCTIDDFLSVQRQSGGRWHNFLHFINNVLVIVTLMEWNFNTNDQIIWFPPHKKIPFATEMFGGGIHTLICWMIFFFFVLCRIIIFFWFDEQFLVVFLAQCSTIRRCIGNLLMNSLQLQWWYINLNYSGCRL